MRPLPLLLAPLFLLACGDSSVGSFDPSQEQTKTPPKGSSSSSPSSSAAPSSTTPSTLAPPPVEMGGRFNALVPVRLWDSRDGTGALVTKSQEMLGAEVEKVLDLNGLDPLLGPAAMRVGVVLNLTVTDTAGSGFLRAYPCGTDPDVSAINFAEGETVGGTVALGVVDKICVKSKVATNLVVDVLGVFQKGMGSLFNETAPRRVYDSREVGKSTGFAIPVFGLPSQADGVVAHVTITEPDGPGFARVAPCGTDTVTSNINFRAGETIGTTTLTSLGGTNMFCITSNVTTHVVVDLEGSFGGGDLRFVPGTPARIFDSRGGGPATTHKIAIPNATAGTKAAALNLTVLGAASGAFVTLHACGEAPGANSNVNVDAGKVRTSFTIAPMSSAGEVCVTANTAVHVIADLAGTLAK